MMLADLVGQRFTRLTVIEAVRHGDRRQWLCRCDCGNDRIVTTGNLRGTTKSCGCLKTETARAALSHGDAGKGSRRSKEYRTWAHIRGRCHNPNDAGYSLYGARGISVCERWRNSYENFLADMGRAPSRNHSIERVDNDGNYEPGNCIWATMAQQVRNKRNTIKVGSGCLKDACEERGISYGAAQARIRRGASIEQALSPLTGAAYRRMVAAYPTPPTTEEEGA